MAIGNRWSSRPRAWQSAIAAVTAGVPPTPVTVVDPDGVLEIRTETLRAQMQQVAFGPGIIITAAVAALAAPPAGQAYRIERMAIANDPGLVQVLGVFAGPAGEQDALRDIASFPTAPWLVTDDPNGIWLPPFTPLHIVWAGPPDVGGLVANVQYRVEEV